MVSAQDCLAGRIYRRGIEPKSIECSILIAFALLPWDLVPANFMAQSSCETDGRSAGLRHIHLLYFICNAHWLTVPAYIIWKFSYKEHFLARRLEETSYFPNTVLTCT